MNGTQLIGFIIIVGSAYCLGLSRARADAYQHDRLTRLEGRLHALDGQGCGGFLVAPAPVPAPEAPANAT